MSLWRDDPRPSPATLVALGCVGLVAVGSLSRLFEGSGYVLWALPGVALGAAFAVWFGRRSLGIGFLLLATAWTLSLPGLFARAESAAGFPTSAGVRTAWDLLGEGLRGVTRTVPPVPVQPRFTILVWTAFLFLGFLGASWVVVRRPVGAIVSALGVVTFAGSLGEGPGRTGFALAAVAATGAFFLSEGRQRIARWSTKQIGVPLWFGVPTLGAACLVAIAAPFLIGDEPLVELRSAIRPRVVIIKPLSDIQRQLKVDPPIEVMRVESEQPTYWRLTGLDSYDGREWVLEARPRSIQDGSIDAPQPPTTGDVIEQRYSLTSLLSPWMPAAYAARSVETDAIVELDESSQTLLLRDQTAPGLVYTVRSQVPHVSANIPAALGASTDERERFFGELARPIVEGASTPLDAARRLESHFHTFGYDDDVEGGHTVARLQRFLTDRTGYCEQFAATMTLMLRGLGVEARVGVGFLPGADTGGEYIVSTRDAHAWVEANIPGAGWTSFDPTPGRSDAPPPPSDAEAMEAPTPPPVPEPTTVPATTPQTQEFPSDVAGTDAPFPAALIWSAVGLAAVSAIPVTKRVRRSVRRSRAPYEAVLGAYTELTDTARDLGWSPRESETQREFLARVGGAEAAGRRGLAALAARTLYGPPGIGDAHAEAAWTALGPTLAAVRARTPSWRRALAPFDPRTLLSSALWRWVRPRAVLRAAGQRI